MSFTDCASAFSNIVIAASSIAGIYASYVALRPAPHPNLSVYTYRKPRVNGVILSPNTNGQESSNINTALILTRMIQILLSLAKERPFRRV